MPIRSDPSSWNDPRHRRGLEGEEIAKAFLKEAGWRILDHRFRMGRLETDLVVRKGKVVAFVEVKMRLTTRFGPPALAVTWHKQREIGRVAQAWIDRYGRPDDRYRFDVIAITQARGLRKIEHIADAFRLGR